MTGGVTDWWVKNVLTRHFFARDYEKSPTGVKMTAYTL